MVLLFSVGDTLATHPGFEPCLCFGDVLLSFAFTGSGNSSPTSSITTVSAQPPPSPSVVLPEIPEVLQHDFVRTHFEKVTQCGFCFKKVVITQ